MVGHRQLELRHDGTRDPDRAWEVHEDGAPIAGFRDEADARAFMAAAGTAPADRGSFDPAQAGWEVLETSGFISLVGPLWTRRDGDDLVFGFLAEPKHHNRRGVVQGGMLMTFADRALGTTAWYANGRRPQATVQLDVHFVDAVAIGEFVEAHCEIVRRTRSVMFMRATLTVGARVVATAAGVWKVLGEK